MKYIWEKITKLDVYVSEKEPWALAKAGKTKELAKVLNEAANGIFEVAKLLEPFLPDTAKRIQEIFSKEEIKKVAPLFPRIT